MIMNCNCIIHSAISHNESLIWMQTLEFIMKYIDDNNINDDRDNDDDDDI